MLGRLARMLRLLGYDTEYSAEMTTVRLEEIARQSGRHILTRGHAEKRFPTLSKVFSVTSDNPSAQLREVVERFKLDVRSGLWTRCTLCNGEIAPVLKADVAAKVPPRVAEVYADFYCCRSCAHVYWRGSHVERILKNLQRLLEARDE